MNEKDVLVSNKMQEENNKENSMTITDCLLPLKKYLTGIEQNQILQELLQGSRELDQLYKKSEQSTFAIKESFDDIKQRERVVNNLHDRYYNALVTKKFHEQDRDEFFKREKELETLRNIYIDKSQQLFYDNSKYVEFNQRFSKDRENQICNILKLTSVANQQNNDLKNENAQLKNELKENQILVKEQHREITNLKNQKTDLQNCQKTLTSKFDELKIENNCLKKVQSRVSKENFKLQNNISEIQIKLNKSFLINQEKEENLTKVQNEKEQFRLQYLQLDLMFEAMKEKMTFLKTNSTKSAEKWILEKENLQKNIKDLKKKLKDSQIRYRKLMIQNQSFQKKLDDTRCQMERARSGKLQAILNEKKIKNRNLQLSEDKFGLINEVLELKEDFLKDQKKIRSGFFINNKLRSENESLQNKILMLKDNRNAVALLEDASELRLVTQHKFTKLPPTSAPNHKSNFQ